MRNFSLLFTFILFITSCGSQNKEEQSSQSNDKPQTNAPTISDKSPQPEGLTLIKGSDCSACHMASQKLVGPSYKDIAVKYKDDSEAKSVMIKSIMEGSSGVWGDIPMPGHPQLTKEEVATMVDYILTVE